MSRVLIASPPIQNRISHHDSGFEPFLGMGYLASVLRARGHEVRVADTRLGRLDHDDLLGLAREFRPEVVGFSAMTHEILRAYDAARQLERQDPRVRIALGGPHASAVPLRTLEECPSIDLACVGEGERTLIDAVETWSGGGEIEHCAGAAWRDGSGAPRQGEERAWERDLDALPFPAWDLFPRSSTYPIMTARGCPYRCNFCCRASGGKVRKRSPVNALDELDWLIREFHPRVVRFEDETLTWDGEHINAVLDGILARGHHRTVSFVGQTRVDRVDHELFRKLKRANFRMIEMGVESGDPGVLAASGKNIDVERVRESFRAAHAAGLRTWAKFILGHPNETPETVRHTVRLAADLNPTLVSFAIMVPFPGTGVWDLATRGEGGYRMISSSWDAFDKFLGNVLELESLPRAALERWQIRGYATVYLRNHRYGEFAGLAWKHRKSAIALVKKIVRHRGARPRAAAAGVPG
jgi:radical SAM superfamily enzyme YgiQ (UPF0313 family)